MILRLSEIREIPRDTTTKRNIGNIKQNKHSITKQREVLQSKGKS